MAMPTLKERLEALGPIADKALVGGRKALETALRTLDAAYDATKQFGQEERAKAIAKWGVEHVQGFEVTVALLGFMLQNGTAPSINSNPLPITPSIAVVEKMAAPKPTVTVISGTPKESSWVEKVGKKATDLHEKISQKSPTNIKHLRPTPKNGTLLDTEPSKKKSAYMDQHTVGYTHQKLANVDSDQGLIDVFMEKWIWEVEDYSGKRYFDGMKTKEYPDGYPTIGLGYNLARNNAFETGKELLGWTDKTFKAYYNGEKTLSKADAKNLARHDLKEMLGALKNTLGDECWEKLNAPQRFAALDLYYNNPSALMGKETVGLFQEAAASGDFEKIAATIADKRNASDLGGSNLRRLANAEFVAGQDMSLKSKALVRQVISPAIKKANDGDTILVRVTRIASIPQAKHMEQYVKLAEGKTVTVVPVMQENVNGVACDVPCGKAISVVGTPKGIDAQAIALDSAALSTGYLFGGTTPSFSQR